MGQQAGKQASPAGFVTVSTAQADAQAPDPDILALQQLPPASPLIKAPGLAGLFGSSRQRPQELPTLDPATLSALGREYAAYCRNAAEPLCEAQKTLAQKMCGLEALCARILYLLALRFNELSGCAATLRDVPQISARLQETQQLLQQCVAQADRLEQLLPSEHGAL